MSLLTGLKKLFGFKNGASSPKASAKDRTLSCEDCRCSFIFDEGEQRFFKLKGFTDPKRCPKCRQQVRSHMRKRFRKERRTKRPARRGHSLIDSRSPYLDDHK